MNRLTRVLSTVLVAALTCSLVLTAVGPLNPPNEDISEKARVIHGVLSTMTIVLSFSYMAESPTHFHRLLSSVGVGVGIGMFFSVM